MKKVCTECGVEKSYNEFGKHAGRKDGKQSYCKSCDAVRKRKYRANNKEKIKEYLKSNSKRIKNRNKKYYEENAEKKKKYSKEYYAANPEKRAEWNLANKEKMKEYQRAWFQENPDKTKAKDSRRRARVAGNGGSFTPKEWRALCKKYNNRCLCCGKKKKLEADHIIPVTWPGGHSNIDNIQPLCRSCNSSKGNRSAADYRICSIINL